MSNNEEKPLFEGKITGFDIMPKGKGAVVHFTDNPVEAGEVTYKELSHKVYRKPSENLSTMLRALLGHAIYYNGWSFGKLTDKELKSRKVVDMPEFKDYAFKGFTIQGDGEDEKLIIKFAKSCAGDEIVGLVTPPIKIAAGEYVYDDILASDLEKVIDEVKLYLAGKNYFVQAKIEFPEPNQDEEVEEEL